MKNIIVVFFVLISASAFGQAVDKLGGKALETLETAEKGKYSSYTTEYKRMYAMFVADGTFEDYFTDGKKYTVFLPDNFAVEEYYAANGGANSNLPRTRNTLKYSIIKGWYTLDKFTDGQTLYTVYPSNPCTVKVKKDKVLIYDKQGNSVKLDKSFEVGNIIFYPVKTVLRY